MGLRIFLGQLLSKVAITVAVILVLGMIFAAFFPMVMDNARSTATQTAIASVALDITQEPPSTHTPPPTQTSLPTHTSTTTQIVNGTQLEVHFIDVGQGDATLIITPDGATALIDGGLSNGLALEYLQRQGLDTLDVIIATHPHQDHIAGLVDIMPVFDVGGVWQPGATHTTNAFRRFLETIQREGIPFYQVGTGDTIPVGNLTFEVLFGAPHANELNNTSLVLRLEFGDVSFLFTGDAEAPIEGFLVATAAGELPTTILKMGHHGSYTSSTPAFVNAVSPIVAVYSAGSNNSYGHPHRGPLMNLEAAGAAVYGTDVHGTVVITTDGETFDIALTHNEPPVVGDVDLVNVHTMPAQPRPTYDPALLETLPYDPFGPDRNCSAFDTHAQAQAFFVAAGGPAIDRHGLDGDDDGIACERLP